MFDCDEKLVYEGDFMQYSFEGIGTLYHPDGVTKLYEGDFYCGKFEGFGKLFDEDGTLIYEGRFKGGKFSGLGLLYKYIDEGSNLSY